MELHVAKLLRFAHSEMVTYKADAVTAKDRLRVKRELDRRARAKAAAAHRLDVRGRTIMPRGRRKP